MNRSRNVAILIFDDLEVLDFCGPFEVFSVAGRGDDLDPFTVYTVAQTSGPIMARNHLSVNPTYTLLDCPQPHILVVPGGYGTRMEMYNTTKARSRETDLVSSVCTGALLLAKVGLLEGLAATTHHGALALLKEVAPHTTVEEDKRIVDNGRGITSAEISAGIDMSLYVISKLLGKDQALKTARYMEYEWKPRS